nr:hypothetical protein [Tanacetum cinerariifolium]
MPTIWFAIISDSNPVFILKASIPPKRKLDLTTGINFLGCPFFKAFLVTADVPEIYMQEFWATAYVHQYSIRFKMDSKKNIVDLETFRNMLHISPRVPGQSFDELPFEEEILDFLRFLGHSAQIKTLTDVNINKLFQPWRSFTAVINKCLTGKVPASTVLEHKNQKKSNEMYYPRFTKVIIHHFITKKPSIPRRNKVNWHYVRDDILFSTIKVVSRHQNTKQYGAILPIELMNEDIRNTKSYKEYYACATGEAAPKPKASARRKMTGSDTFITPLTAITTPTTTFSAAPRLTTAAKGKQPAKAKSPTDPSEAARTEAEQLKIVLRRSRQESHISQLGGSSIDEGTRSKPGVPDVPSDDSEEEISWNSSDDEDVDAQDKDKNDDEGDKEDESDDGKEDDDDADKDGAERDDDDDDDDDEEEIAKIDEPEDTESGGGDDEETKSDEESEEEETREEKEESFDPILRTSEDSDDDGNGEDDQGLRVSEEQRLIEEEEANELYRDVDINQRRGLQLSADIEDSHVNLTSVNPDGQQESSSVSSQSVSSMLNPTSDAGMDSIFETASSPMTPLQTTAPIMTPSTIAIITTISRAPIPPTTIPSEVLQNLPTFDSMFHFEDRLKSLEVNFSKFIQTNQFAEAVSNISGRSTTGSKSRQASASESAFAEEPVQTISQIEEPSHLVFETGAEDQPIVQTSQHPEWFPLPKKPPTLDRDWNKTLPAVQGSAQT